MAISYLPQIADKLQLLSMRLYQVHMTMGGNKMLFGLTRQGLTLKASTLTISHYASGGLLQCQFFFHNV
jgi:hypothetical protein